MQISNFKIEKYHDTIKVGSPNIGKLGKMPKDTFEKSNVKPFVVDSAIDLDYEGYINFYPKNDSENILTAKYFISKPENSTVYEVGSNIGGKIKLRDITDVKPFSKAEKTYILQEDDSIDECDTKVLGKITSKLNNGMYEVEVDNFPTKIIINDVLDNELEIGSYALFTGSLIYEE